MCAAGVCALQVPTESLEVAGLLQLERSSTRISCHLIHLFPSPARTPAASTITWELHDASGPVAECVTPSLVATTTPSFPSPPLTRHVATCSRNSRRKASRPLPGEYSSQQTLQTANPRRLQRPATQETETRLIQGHASRPRR